VNYVRIPQAPRRPIPIIILSFVTAGPGVSTWASIDFYCTAWLRYNISLLPNLRLFPFNIPIIDISNTFKQLHWLLHTGNYHLVSLPKA
jgi:hypothetical protein